MALTPLAPAAACPEAPHTSAAPPLSHRAPDMAAAKFDWPVRGQIVVECWTEDASKVVIAARNGAEVRAARSGRVLFAGEFKGYGNLVLIRHDGDVVSAAYGDIVGLRVQTRDVVEAGQAIAEMYAPQESVAPELRFELRQAGAPINPRPLMQTSEPPTDSADAMAPK